MKYIRVLLRHYISELGICIITAISHVYDRIIVVIKS